AAYERGRRGGMEFIPTRFLHPEAQKKLTKNAERSHFRSEAHHHVELCGEFANAGAGQGSERNDHGVFCIWVVNAIKNSVSFVSWLTFDVALRCELLVAASFDGEMDV